LKKEKEESLEQLWVAQQEKDDIRAKFEEDREKIQKEKDQLLVEQMGVREAVTRELRSMSGLAQIEEETTKSQVGKLVEAIQQLQARVAELELQAVSKHSTGSVGSERRNFQEHSRKNQGVGFRMKAIK
jgi:hypothetical protein